MNKYVFKLDNNNTKLSYSKPNLDEIKSLVNVKMDMYFEKSNKYIPILNSKVLSKDGTIYKVVDIIVSYENHPSEERFLNFIILKEL